MGWVISSHLLSQVWVGGLRVTWFVRHRLPGSAPRAPQAHPAAGQGLVSRSLFSLHPRRVGAGGCQLRWQRPGAGRYGGQGSRPQCRGHGGTAHPAALSGPEKSGTPLYRVLGSQEMQLSCTWLDAFMSSTPEQRFQVFALMREPPT